MWIMPFFSKKNQQKVTAKHWYADQYRAVVIQRNFLVIITAIAIAATLSSVFVVKQVTDSRTVEPYVIEVESRSGVTNVIRPLDLNSLVTNIPIQKYFINKYVYAREVYNPGSYEYNYFFVTRILSAATAYYDFVRTVNPGELQRLGSKGKNVRINYANILPGRAPTGDLHAEIGFTEFFADGRTKNKTAIMYYNFFDLELNDDQRAINPVGFNVTNYFYK